MAETLTNDSRKELNGTEEGADPANPTPEGSASENTGEKQDGVEAKKKSAQERIREAIERRNKAESDAQAAKREAEDLRTQLQMLKTQAPDMQEADKPTRDKYKTDEDYIEALADWKAKKAIADREREQQEARRKAEVEEIVAAWNKRQEQAMKDIPDYADVVGASEVQMAPHVHQAIVESDVGPQLAYYFALNPDELRRLNSMRAATAMRQILRIETEIGEDEPSKPNTPTKSKAPPPIDPVKGSSANPGAATSFEEYRKRRQEQQKAAQRR